MLRFYPSLTIEDITAMTPQESKYYIQAMERIRARERLYTMDAIAYPNMQEKDRRKKHREVYKIAYPENFDMRKIKTTDLELI